ncbi:MAG: hypothetical protein DRI56_04160 [Chloroflexota bacterium]|nr:MAG: hypothetical protein DRI56_04160 [Chloroflexota bacterium]
MNILDINIPIILFIQNLGSWLNGPMAFITSLGNENFYLLIIPFCYWCVDTGLGIRLGFMLLLSDGFYNTLKILFHSPRPYWYSAEVRAISTGSAFGFPSGHSQNAAALWGLAAAFIGRRWAWITAIGVAFLIGISRIYLGVHFPIDVLAGWALGAFMVWIFLKAEKPLVTWFKKQSLAIQIGGFFGAAVFIIIAGALAKASLGSWQIPEIWRQNAGSGIDPLTMQGFFTSMGMFFGVGAGIAIFARFNDPLDVSGPWFQRALRYVVGFVGMIVIYAGLDALFMEGNSALALGLRFIRYMLVGLWIFLGAPLVFKRLKLVS